MKKQRKKKNTAANADKEIKVNTSKHPQHPAHETSEWKKHKGDEVLRNLVCVFWTEVRFSFLIIVFFISYKSVGFVSSVVVDLKNFNYVNTLLKHSFAISIHYSLQQSIQAMDEEKNKLDAFCEQSLKNVSGVFFSFQIEWILFFVFKFCSQLRLVKRRASIKKTVIQRMANSKQLEQSDLNETVTDYIPTTRNRDNRTEYSKIDQQLM